MRKALSTVLILLLWPWWTARAVVLSAAGVSLIVSRAIVAEWKA